MCVQLRERRGGLRVRTRARVSTCAAASRRREQELAAVVCIGAPTPPRPPAPPPDLRYAFDPLVLPLWFPVIPYGPSGPKPPPPSSRLVPPPPSSSLGATGYDFWRLALPHVTLDCEGAAVRGAAGEAAGLPSCCGSADYLAAAAVAVSTWTPNFPLAVAAPRRRPALTAWPSSDVLPRESADICDGVVSDCCAILTPSTRKLVVPNAPLSLIVASVNASCGGQCAVLDGAGLGLLCDFDSCLATAAPSTSLHHTTLPNLTFTFNANGASNGLGASSSGLWDLTLVPEDYIRKVSGDAAAAALREAGGLAATAGSHWLPAALRASLEAAEALNPAQPLPEALLLRVLVEPFSPAAGLPPTTWVLGAPFMQAFYSIYDARSEAPLVGLAPALGAHEPAPSRYASDGNAWSGFWGSASMWEFVAGALVVGLVGVGSYQLRRRARRAVRARAYEATYRQRLLLGLDPHSGDLSGLGGEEADWGALAGRSIDGMKAPAEAADETPQGATAVEVATAGGAAKRSEWGALSPLAASQQQLCDYGVLDSYAHSEDSGDAAADGAETDGRPPVETASAFASPLYTPPAVMHLNPRQTHASARKNLPF